MIKKKLYFVDSIVVYKAGLHISQFAAAEKKKMDQENRLSWAASFM